MSESRETNRKNQAAAETARQGGAQGRAGKPPSDTLGNGAMDVSDPKMEAEITDVAEQVHAPA